MKKRFPFSPFPRGWFCVGFSEQLAPGAILSRTYFGQDVVLLRTPSGKPAMHQAHCPHMGAHLGHGGTFEGENLRCPMHGFCFSDNGNCVSTPYQTIVPKVRLRSWPIEEMHGLLLAYHDETGAAPSFSVPDLDFGNWGAAHTACWTLRSHPQETSENSVDLGHFGAVHRYHEPKLRSGPHLDGPHLRMEYSFKRRPGALRIFGIRELAVDFEAKVHGLGYSTVLSKVPALGVQTREIVLATPTDGEHIELRVVLRVGPRDGGDSAIMSKVPWQLVQRVFGTLGFREFCGDLAQDFEIWENKQYLERPMLAKGDGPIPAYRRWASQFYGPSAESIAAE